MYPPYGSACSNEWCYVGCWTVLQLFTYDTSPIYAWYNLYARRQLWLTRVGYASGVDALPLQTILILELYRTKNYSLSAARTLIRLYIRPSDQAVREARSFLRSVTVRISPSIKQRQSTSDQRSCDRLDHHTFLDSFLKTYCRCLYVELSWNENSENWKP